MFIQIFSFMYNKEFDNIIRIICNESINIEWEYKI